MIPNFALSSLSIPTVFNSIRFSGNDLHFPGAPEATFINHPEFIQHHPTVPCYRLIDEDGVPLPDVTLPDISKDTCVKLYESMLTLRAMDDTLYQAQRMGKISFYMTSYSEEPTHFGTALALSMDDIVYGQYREAGVLLWRGYTLQEFTDQCASNHREIGKGKQMPVHYGAPHLNFHTISSPLGTQIPHAAGAGYGLRLSNADAVAACYFGDGAASEGDFHVALNFAATLKSPTLFICRNNGYAISTPVHDQYHGDGIVSRGPGYGMKSIRVDGMDLFATYDATKKARELALQNNEPVLIECMSYRGGHHSTSDDSSRYRSAEEIKYWVEEKSPLNRFRNYLANQGWWDPKDDETFYKEKVEEVRHCLEKSLQDSMASPLDMFEDVYDQPTPRLIQQREQLIEHLKKHGRHYNLHRYLPISDDFTFEESASESEYE